MPDAQYLLRRAALAERAAEALQAFPEFQERLQAQARDWRRLAEAAPEGAADKASDLLQAAGAKVPQVSSSVAACAALLSSAGAL